MPLSGPMAQSVGTLIADCRMWQVREEFDPACMIPSLKHQTQCIDNRAAAAVDADCFFSCSVY
jgi:hypothetical protein